MRRPALRTLYALLTYLLALPLMGWFGILGMRDVPFQWSHLAYQLCAWLGLSATPLLPAWLFATLGGDPSCARSRGVRFVRLACWVLAGLLCGLATTLLMVDIGIHRQFGFHFNGLVLNLLTTPGGFESMGLDYRTIVPGVLLIALVMVFHLALALCTPCLKCLRKLANRLGDLPHWLGQGWLAVPAAAFGVALLLFGIAEFYQNNVITSAGATYPIPMRVRMHKLLKRLGCTPPPRKAHRGKEFRKSAARLNYPWAQVERTVPANPPDILWFVAESLRADLLSPERMPNTWRFAEEHGIRFANHYSGGNGTRPGMFSMFYALHANAWDSFLGNNRGPLLFDWLIADNYQLLAQTSAKFTYPEFDRTVFADFPQECLVEQSSRQPAWQRDILATDNLLKALRGRDTARPFFGFIFFEATHAPYTFPPDQTPFQPYLENLNYTNVSAAQREFLYNRDANAAHHVDAQLGRIFDFLQETGRLENTIVIVTGDHGEEFYEHGRLGHNSTFVREQISPALVMHFPGVAPAVYQGLSHHTDLIPTLAPWLGVTNPPNDFSVGGNLLAPDYHREFFVVFGWDIAIFANRDGKLLLPISFKSQYTLNPLTTFDDLPTGGTTTSSMINGQCKSSPQMTR